MKEFDIQVNIRVLASSEPSAEQKVWDWLKAGNVDKAAFEIIDWDFLQFVGANSDDEKPPL